MFNPCVASIVSRGTKTLEEQMLEMRMMLEQVLKRDVEKNKQLDKLPREMIELGKRKVKEAAPVIEVKDNNVDKVITADIAKIEDGVVDDKLLHQMVANAVKNQLAGDSSNGRYTKLYSKRIDNLHMPQNYQPPKFQQFDGKGNPKQHIAHFVETCNNAGTKGDLLVKQFVCSLKGVTFNWYTDMDAYSIDNWNQMEDEF